MIAERFIAQTRRAAQRTWLPMLAGGALTAGVAGPATASARTAGKNKHKDKDKKAKKRCKQHEAQCVTAITEFCARMMDPLPCESVFLPCCARFTGCDVEPGIACLYAPMIG